MVLLRVVDEYWMEHIGAMSDLRQGIRLRAYAQTDPIIAYKKESLEMFEEMIAAIQDETVRRLYPCVCRKRGGQAPASGQRHLRECRRRRHREKAAPQGQENRPQRAPALRQRQEV